MLNSSMKEAIKFGLALILTMLISMWLGWAKTSWSMLTVMVLATTDTYGYSALKGRNRLYGTAIGSAVAFILIALFSQDRVLFIASLGMFLWFCVYMSSHKKRGYMYNIAITVCLIISSALATDSATVFNTAILRMQDTFLGIICFSLVYRLVWPKKTESAYMSTASGMQSTLVKVKGIVEKCQPMSADDIASINDDINSLKQDVNKLNELLTLPYGDSVLFRSYRNNVELQAKLLNEAVSVSEQAVINLDNQNKHKLISKLNELLSDIENVSFTSHTTESKGFFTGHVYDAESYSIPKDKRINFANIALSVLVTAFAMWIYMPIPGGALFPTLAAVLAANVMTIPGKAVKHIMLVYVVIALILLLQFVFIMPKLTEAWQLFLLYFTNAVVIWRGCDVLNLSPLKALAGNILVNIPGGATELTPSYNILGPLTMIVLLMLALMIIEFYSRLFTART
ncbi:FUSC family protein [Shewanella gaetbuli]|uniref:FUSC family protein n=1 Tax=Shewanella gaetbuli TaxID=220752 RepID=A0A9X1ZQR8_9GAMM|nr:FUSC family protein [Shewanella gaetbuli]MCL1143815.1 FUSC family protein [Shewanella gaetbuli]